MKSVFGYLNPLNLVKNERRSSIDSQFHIINIEFDDDQQYAFDRYLVQEQEPYDEGDLKLIDLEDIYLNHYDLLHDQTDHDKHFIDYVVQSDDTLEGIALKFNVNPKRVLEWNSISEESVVTGIRLKLRSQPVYIQTVHENHNHCFLGRNLLDEIMANGSTKKFQVFYLTEIGHIAGTLSINEDILFFDPNLSEANSRLSPKGTLSQLQASVSLKDIKNAHPIVLPTRMSQFSSLCQRDFIVQIVLQGLGKRRVAHASIFFRLADSTSEQQAIDYIGDICETINQIVSQKRQQYEQMTEEEQKLLLLDEDLTLVPFFDLSEEANIPVLIERSNKIWGGSSFIPQMMGDSMILTSDSFLQIVSHVPSVFKNGNWKLIYNNQVNGSSINTLFKLNENHSPCIIVIKELQSSQIFGAYLTDYLHSVISSFYGGGETFLFTFQNNFRTFPWTQKNQHFIFCDSCGIGVGCGEKYGLFIKGDLTGGYSTKCDTFDNEVLSTTEDFEIDLIELWALDIY